jgi:cytoskeletal protein CcmA (bactofilin family)
MREERQRIVGDFSCAERMTIWGGVTGDLRVVEGGKLYLRGNVGGDLIVDFGGRVHIYGHIAGNLQLFRGAKVVLSGTVGENAANQNGRLFIDRHGRVIGRVKTTGKHAETHIEDQFGGMRVEYGKDR